MIKRTKKAPFKPEMIKIMWEYFNSDIVNYQQALNGFIIQRKKLKPRILNPNILKEYIEKNRKMYLKEYNDKIAFMNEQIALLNGRINLASNLRSFCKAWLDELNQPQ